MKRIYVCLLIFLCFAFVQAQKIKHPALLYTPERIQQVKQRIVNDLKMAEAWASIKKTADEQLQKKNLSKADYLALAYLMTDEKKYADKLKEILLSLRRIRGAVKKCWRVSLSGERIWDWHIRLTFLP